MHLPRPASSARSTLNFGMYQEIGATNAVGVLSRRAPTELFLYLILALQLVKTNSSNSSAISCKLPVFRTSKCSSMWTIIANNRICPPSRQAFLAPSNQLTNRWAQPRIAHLSLEALNVSTHDAFARWKNSNVLMSSKWWFEKTRQRENLCVADILHYKPLTFVTNLFH